MSGADHRDWPDLAERLRREIALLSDLARQVECAIAEDVFGAEAGRPPGRGLQQLDLLIQSTDALEQVLARLAERGHRDETLDLDHALRDLPLGAMAARLASTDGKPARADFPDPRQQSKHHLDEFF